MFFKNFFVVVIALSVLLSGRSFSQSVEGWTLVTKTNAPKSMDSLLKDVDLDTGYIEVVNSFTSRKSIEIIASDGKSGDGFAVFRKVYNLSIQESLHIIGEMLGFAGFPPFTDTVEVGWVMLSNGIIYNTHPFWNPLNLQPSQTRDFGLWDESGKPAMTLDTLFAFIKLSISDARWKYLIDFDNLRYKTDDTTVLFDSCGEGWIATEEAAKVSRDLMEVSVFPNPFISFVQINNAPNNAQMDVVDLTGRVVKTLTEPFWNGCDAMGRKLPTGAYFLRVKTEKTTTMKKIVLMR
ncbi:MAG: T9SS type A sorting domain-containing protein [Patescibacteria group bacterium]